MGPGCELIELTVQISNAELVALQDCGAMHNYISLGLVKQLELTQQLVSLITVTMANNQVVITDKSVMVPLKFGAKLRMLPSQVLQTQSTLVLLGMQLLETVNPMVDWVTKSVSQTDAEKEHTIIGKKWSNSGSVQLVFLDAFYQSVRDSDCTGSQKVQIIPQRQKGRINTIKAQKEEPVDPKVAAILEKYCIFFDAPEQLPPTRAIAHQLKLFDKTVLPPKQCWYQLTQEESQAVRDNTDLYLQCRWIWTSCSQHRYPVLIIRKKDGTLRMAVDYRSLNNKTIPDRFPLPSIDDILESLGQSAVFTKLDLDSGYHQVSLDPADMHKTAFLSKWGIYKYTMLLLGLTNALATFQCLLNQILRPWLDKGVVVYLDDIIIYSKNMQEHVNILEQILARLAEH